MIPIEEAKAIVLESVEPLEPKRIDLDECIGLVDAEDIASDRDYPPFDKAMMDGYAVCAADLAEVPKRLPISGEVAAGEGSGALERGGCVRIMTGAPVPDGADAVVPVEDAGELDGEVEFRYRPKRWANIARQGEDRRAGEVVVPKGTVIGPVAIAAIASVGMTRPLVYPKPVIALITTGDEIVPFDGAPQPTQIRDTNSHSLAAQAAMCGFRIRKIAHVADDPDALRRSIAGALDECDVLILSGGVSMGRYDYIPGVLEDLGVERRFHKVFQQPGKPLWFGIKGRKPVFGTPGNPLATHVCFDQYILPALWKMVGREDCRVPHSGVLTEAVSAKKSGRVRFMLGFARLVDGRFEIAPLVGSGSADIFTTVRANAIFRLNPGERREAGDEVMFTFLGGREGGTL